VESAPAEREAVEFLPWTENINDLAAFMSRAEDFFGLDDMDVDGEPDNGVPVTVG
jgi:hypothetical protein